MKLTHLKTLDVAQSSHFDSIGSFQELEKAITAFALEQGIVGSNPYNDRVGFAYEVYCGVDIMLDNVEECRGRLLEAAKMSGNVAALAIVERNVVCADALTYEWEFGKMYQTRIDERLNLPRLWDPNRGLIGQYLSRDPVALPDGSFKGLMDGRDFNPPKPDIQYGSLPGKLATECYDIVYTADGKLLKQTPTGRYYSIT
jgi:hypothetical protein